MTNQKRLQSIASGGSKTYDVYGSYRIPFDIGTWARGHKFDMTAVQMTRNLIRINALEEQRSEILKQIDDEEAKLREAIAEARQKMEASNGI